MEIIEKYIIPVMQIIFVFGIPVILVIVAIIILCNIFLVPHIKTAQSNVKKEYNARVVDKRKEVMSNVHGIYTMYFITFELENCDRIELKTTRGVYKKANFNDKGNILFKEKVELLKAFEIVKESGENTKGSTNHVVGLMRSSLNNMPQKKENNKKLSN